jgi:hypothetical protein
VGRNSDPHPHLSEAADVGPGRSCRGSRDLSRVGGGRGGPWGTCSRRRVDPDRILAPGRSCGFNRSKCVGVAISPACRPCQRGGARGEPKLPGPARTRCFRERSGGHLPVLPELEEGGARISDLARSTWAAAFEADTSGEEDERRRPVAASSVGSCGRVVRSTSSFSQ